MDTNTPLGQGLGFVPTANLVLPNPFSGHGSQAFSRGGSHRKRHVLFAPWPLSLAAPTDPRQRLLNQRIITRLRHCPRGLPRRTTTACLTTRGLPGQDPACLQSRIRQPAARQTLSRLMPFRMASWKRSMASPGPEQGDNRRPRALTSSPARGSLPFSAESDNQCPGKSRPFC